VQPQAHLQLETVEDNRADRGESNHEKELRERSSVRLRRSRIGDECLARMLLLKHDMKLRCFAPICGILLLVAMSGYAQDNPAHVPATPLDHSFFSKLSGAFNKPLHPVVQGVAPGGGLGVGVGYDFPSRGHWETTTQAIVTVRRYWSAEFDTTYRGDRALFEGYARMREMTQLGFFGTGMDSVVAGRTNFLLRDSVIGALGSVHVAPERLARLTSEQWMDAFRAGGYTDTEASRFIRRLREKIEEGLRLSAPSDVRNARAATTESRSR
jgi:hypothetical protein